jgi:hypothetical protein
MANTYTLEQLAEAKTLPCTRCKGTGIRERMVDREAGVDIPARPCIACDGLQTFNAPDVTHLLGLIKGRKAGALRSRRPENPRAYYIWRFARFHGGQDVTLPMQASFEVMGDPFIPLLNAIAEKVAQHVYGTEMAGSLRWAHAMGHEVSDRYLDGSEIVPASAMPGGPVVLDNHKPYSEQAELV